jgi:hypothetical protein
MEVALPALAVAIVIVISVLARLRARTKPAQDDDVPAPQPRRRRTRTERMLEKLEPLPEIPTLMDLVRLEIAEEGIDEIPGREGLPDGVALKVYRRDEAARTGCAHQEYEYRVVSGVAPADATEADVRLVCPRCEAGGSGT